jgi:hypothetical protein
VPELDKARQAFASGDLGASIRELQACPSTARDQSAAEAVIALAADIRSKTSKRRHQIQCDALIAYAQSAVTRLSSPPAPVPRSEKPRAVEVENISIFAGEPSQLYRVL